jgi:hypothetical protein
VAVVTGVLLDQMQVDEPERHLGAPEVERVVQRVVGDRGVGQLELFGQPSVIRRGPRRVGAGELGLGVVAEDGFHRLPGEPDPEPDPLHLRHVPD